MSHQRLCSHSQHSLRFRWQAMHMQSQHYQPWSMRVSKGKQMMTIMVGMANTALCANLTTARRHRSSMLVVAVRRHQEVTVAASRPRCLQQLRLRQRGALCIMVGEAVAVHTS